MPTQIHKSLGNPFSQRGFSLMNFSVCGECISLSFLLLFPKENKSRRRKLKLPRSYCVLGPSSRTSFYIHPTPQLGCKFCSVHFLEKEPRLGLSATPNTPSSWVMDPGFGPISVEPTSRLWWLLQAHVKLSLGLTGTHRSDSAVTTDGLESTSSLSTEWFSHKRGGSVVLAPLHPWEEATELIIWAMSPWVVSSEVMITACGCHPDQSFCSQSSLREMPVPELNCSLTWFG